ncbi:MAG: hypothetical protein IT259_20090 [Saprospiraceae bacterium]|nr:hypothetical protein [Saprospiraceae bacterium]
MKKSIARHWLIPAVIVLSASVYFSFNWPSGGPTLNAPTVQYNSVKNQYEYFFTLGSLPTPADSFDASHTLVVPAANDFDNWRVLATFDDGTYWMGTKAAFESTGFAFEQTGNHSVQVEVAPTYDDTNTNPGRIANGSFNVNSAHSTPGAAAQRTPAMPAGSMVRLGSSLSPRKGNILTYIIEYQNPTDGRCDNLNGDLKLYVDKNVINYDVTDEFETSTAATAADVTLNGVVYKEITLPFQNLNRGARRNAFVRCTTSTAVNTATHYNTPWVDFIAPQSPACGVAIQAQSSLPSQTIVDSHDPNNKVVAEQNICMTQDSVTFTVTFQNNGTGPTDKIVVEDELHYLLKNESPKLIKWPTAQMPVVSPPGNDRKVVFTLDPYALRGLNEEGLNTSFSEADTKASISFRCAIDPVKAAQYPCNAILNRARIRFDCNPWMETDLAAAYINCQSCDTCLTVADSAYFVNDTFPVNGIPILTPGLIDLIQSPPFTFGFNKQLWYPGADLNQPTDLNPVFSNPKHQQYTLIVSQGNTATTCTRGRLDITYDNDCDLGIQVNTSGLQIDPCTGVVNGTLTATATGNHSGNLQWHECPENGLSMSRQLVNTTQLKYYFGLTDEDTGCSAEIIYEIKLPPCNNGGGGGGCFGNVSWPAAAAAVAALLLLIRLVGRRFLKKS